MTTDQALLKFAAVTAQAVTDALRAICGPQVEPGAARIAGDDEDPLADVALPAFVTRAAYVDGASGGSLIALPVATARQLAAAMMGADAPEGEAATLSETELSVLAEAASQMVSAAAQAVAGLMGREVEVGEPETDLMTSAPASVAEAGALAAHVDFTLFETPCRLIALVPEEFLAQLTQTLDETLVEHDSAPLKAALCDIPVRVWVELGRARMPLGRLIGLPAGEVVELDRDVDDPVELYVDGMHVARGRLVVSDSGEFLTLQIESLIHADDALAAQAAAAA